MAIVASLIIDPNATKLPDGYVQTPLPAQTAPLANGSFTTEVAGTEADPTPATGFDNIKAALKTYFEGTFGPGLKLDVLQSIAANVTVIKLFRGNTGDAESAAKAGTEVYFCTCTYVYE